MQICDLHTHTTASDGSESPRELLEKAEAVGLKAIAITDHDTVDGVRGLMESGALRRFQVELIPGVELSVLAPKGNMHILGYLINVESPGLMETLSLVQRARAHRNPRMVEKLKALGIPITMGILDEMARGGQVGRPHFARALVELGAVRTVQEAFDSYLKRGAAAYVPKSVLEPRYAIEAIHAAGGVAVLAHPFSLKCNSTDELIRVVDELVDNGLDGIECYYSEHTGDFTRQLIRIARSRGLCVTGGTDYHGKAKPHIALGHGRGGLNIPYECVEELVRRCRSCGTPQRKTAP